MTNNRLTFDSWWSHNRQAIATNALKAARSAWDAMENEANKHQIQVQLEYTKTLRDINLVMQIKNEHIKKLEIKLAKAHSDAGWAGEAHEAVAEELRWHKEQY